MSGVFDEVAAKERFDDENWGEAAINHATALASALVQNPDKWQKIITAAKDACKKVAPSSLSHDTTLSSALPENMALSDPETDEEEPAGVDEQVEVRVADAEGAVEVDQEQNAEERPKVVEVSDGEDVGGEESNGEDVGGEESGGEDVGGEESDGEEVSGEESGGKELAVEDEHSGRYDYGIDEEEVEELGGADSDTYGTPAPNDVMMIDASPDSSASSETKAQALNKSMAVDDHPFSDDDA